MDKKKAIKIVTATAIAASAFTAVAPAQSEAASNLDKQISKAKSTMKKPYDTYYANATKLASVSTVSKEIAAAKKAESDAIKAINKAKLSASAKKKKIADVKKYEVYITRAQGYVNGYNAVAKASATLAKQYAQLEATVATKDVAKITAQYTALQNAIKAAKKNIQNTVYGTKVETLLFNKFTKTTEDKLASEVKKVLDQLKAEQALKVESVSTIGDKTISVTFTNKDTVEFKLDKALVDGDNQATVNYKGKDFTLTVKFDANAFAVKTATDAVAVAEGSLLELDLASASDLVNALPTSNDKTLLLARVNAVQSQINGLVAAVNSTDTQVELYNALNVKPFVNVNVDYIADYANALSAKNFTKLSDIQSVINTVNASKINAEVTTLVNNAKTAVAAAQADPTGSVTVSGTTTKKIDAAQTAIDALPTSIPEAVATALQVKVTVKADLQAQLNDVKVVAPVLAATNQVQLLSALQNPAFVRVNSDLIAAYDTALDGSQLTVSSIQAVIDAQNLSAAQTAVTNAEGALTTASVDTASALVNVLPDLDPNTVKTGLQDRLAVVKGLIAVQSSTTEAQLLAALQNPALALTSVNPAAVHDYKTLLATATIDTAAHVQVNIVDAGNAVALQTAVSDVTTNFATYDATNADNQKDALAKLSRLADVSSLQSSVIDSTLVQQYIDAIQVDLSSQTSTIKAASSNADAVTAINALLGSVNANKEAIQRLAAVNSASNSTDMKTALTDVAVAESVSDYINLSTTGKLEVAQLVLAARNGITASPAKTFASTIAVKTEIGNQITARTTFLSGVNAVNTSTGTISDMVTALDVAQFPEFQALTSTQKIDAAELVFNKLKELEAQTIPAKFETITAVKQAAGL